MVDVSLIHFSAELSVSTKARIAHFGLSGESSRCSSMQIKKSQSFLTCFANTAMSSLKDSDEQTSPPATPGSLGVQVANSHFSKISASKGNRGCLGTHTIANVTRENSAGVKTTPG